MKEFKSLEEIQKDINYSYLTTKMKKDNDRKSKQIDEFTKYNIEMINFMYSKLNEEDKKHVDELKQKMKEALASK